MPDKNVPRDEGALWDVVRRTENTVTEIRTMLRMHLESVELHHRPPCEHARRLERDLKNHIEAAGVDVKRGTERAEDRRLYLVLTIIGTGLSAAVGTAVVAWIGG